jgi:hypothetical protein
MKTNSSHLEVPKCEIFDCSDFHDFYTVKSLRESDSEVCASEMKRYLVKVTSLYFSPKAPNPERFSERSKSHTSAPLTRLYVDEKYILLDWKYYLRAAPGGSSQG